MMKFHLFLVFVIYCEYVNLCGCIKLLPNSTFQDLLVYIKDDVPEGNGVLLQNIKNYITKMSDSLWTATTALVPNGSPGESQEGVQIGNVIIRIPKSWKLPGDEVVNVKCNDANIFVTSIKENNNESLPFTKQIEGCGSPGQFTRYPHTFFGPTDNTTVTRNGKVMMTEFVKWRYGVFSEKPYRNILTTFDGERYVQSSCGAQIPWTLNRSLEECSIPNKDCIYSINHPQINQYSVMFDTDTSESVYFCNDHDRPHNKLAKSLQNIKCDGQSISRVILNHKDFRTQRVRTPKSLVRFTITKDHERKIVIVLDTSWSMINIMDNMKEAVVSFIINKVENSSQVGLVTFNTNAQIISSLSPMNDPINRHNLTLKVRGLQPGGMTNIPDGLRRAVEVLGSNINSNESTSGTIILLSDGHNNQENYLYNIYIDSVIRKGILVNTISYGSTTDVQLNRLATSSGGQCLYSDTGKHFTHLLDKFSVKETCDSVFESSIKVMEVEVTMNVSRGRGQRRLAHLDPFIGKDLLLTVMTGIDTSNYKNSLIDPNNVSHSHTGIVQQQAGTTLTFNIPGKVMEGNYTLDIETNTTNPFNYPMRNFKVSVTVSATPDIDSTRTINPSGQLSITLIDLVNSHTKVIATVDMSSAGVRPEERVQVSLRVTYPSNREVVLIMRDNGVGSDSISEDRIFTKALFNKQLTEVGFYNFQATVTISTREAPPIVRTVSLGTLRVLRIIRGPMEDKVRPARIEDVTVVIIDRSKKVLRLDFHATGNDDLNGNISTYDVALKTREAPIQFKTVTIHARPLQRVSILLNLIAVTGSTPFELFVRGVDDRNNAGRWSRSVIHTWKNNPIRRIAGRNRRNRRIRIIVNINFSK